MDTKSSNNVQYPYPRYWVYDSLKADARLVAAQSCFYNALKYKKLGYVIVTEPRK